MVKLRPVEVARPRTWLVLAALASATACIGPGVYECETDLECGGGAAVCTQNGYCGFPNSDCKSGYEYAEHSGPGLGGECVPEQEVDSTGEEDDGSGSTDSTDSTGTTDETGDSGSETPDTGESEETGAEPECGNSILEDGEVCDLNIDNAACAKDCQSYDCVEGFDDCNGAAQDGCEADLTQPTSCGTCDNVCDALGCNDGECPMLVFLTTQSWSAAEMGGIAGADAKCVAAADAKNLGGTYKAWIGTGASYPSKDFYGSDQPYLRPDGTMVALDFNDLFDGFLDAPIMFTLDLVEPAPTMMCPNAVWTNVRETGIYQASQACQSFTGSMNNEIAVTGNWTAVDGTWTEGCFDACTSSHPLYCFQQDP